ncbi:MAG: hypothetical protein EOO68_21830 [Moraxellaceae bacterium]|nr:MAG: hypothetical protein EOO68_21830 [Moraxellaceae bacterium]
MQRRSGFQDFCQQPELLHHQGFKEWQKAAATANKDADGNTTTIDVLASLALNYGINLNVTSGTNSIAIGADGKFTVTAGSAGNPIYPTNSTPLTAGGFGYVRDKNNAISATNPIYSSPEQAAYYYYGSNSTVVALSCPQNANNPEVYSCMVTYNYGYVGGGASVFKIANQKTCNTALAYSTGTACIDDTPPPTTGGSTTTTAGISSSAGVRNTIGESSNGISVSPQSVADVSNAIWNKVSNDPAYPGIRATSSNPVTAADAAAAEATTRVSAPAGTTLGSTLTPVAAGAVSSPTSPPLTNAETGAVVGAPTAPTTAEPAPAPNIGQPSLQAPPTAKMILDPLLNLMPSIRNFQVPAYQTECLTLTIDFMFLGQQFYANPTYHCQLAADNRTAMRAAMKIAFTIAVVFIILGA